MVRSTGLAVAAIQVLFGVGIASAQEVPECGRLENAFGPYDYRDPTARGNPLHLVESAHFTSGVESLRSGATTVVIGDIDYTLRAFPNHHRALNSVSRYALGGGKFLSETIPTADCFFQRAIVFAPDDQVVRLIYGNYLFRRKKLDEAKAQYESALKLAPESPDINYNAALFYLEIHDLQRAKDLAKVAYDKGYPLPGLRNKIAEAEGSKAKR